ncbi:cuticle protein 16.8 [Trichonephila inaurata madagascariensis]|uniref:Cuticle protein 16.8 n=1 Tax=Trichonephila inaurata madagascariensis TaxID=2747483 RepID=A0A8X7CLB1_9ARAC|nr:cuticle protein 16.8 [Trichonephila inaurata madagascariensis]
MILNLLFLFVANSPYAASNFEDLNGIERVVEYVADEHGYRADIKTNEPGTESQNPANVVLHASPVVVDAPKAYAAPRPLYQAPRYAAPAYPKY